MNGQVSLIGKKGVPDLSQAARAVDGWWMKLQALGAVIAAPLFLAGPLIQNGQTGGQDDIRALVDIQTKQISELRIELTETRDLLDMALGHMQSQGDAAKALQGSLAKVESLGFTAGINSNSRVALLSGLRGYLAKQQGAPKAGAEAPKAKSE